MDDVPRRPSPTPSGEDEQTAVADPWVTLVWNDPVNLMSYVTYVFESYFGYPRRRPSDS